MLDTLYVPDVTEGDAFHDLMASVIKLMAKNKKIIAMPARTIGMTFIILNIDQPMIFTKTS